MKKYLLILTTIFALTAPAMAEQVKAKPSKPAKTKNVDGKLPLLSSHIKSIGTVGKTSRYTIISARVRGLDSPNISALLAYDEENDTLAVLASGVEPGLGVAIVNGGASVGGNYLFGSKLRPDRTSVNNNSESSGSSAKSTSEGGDAVSISKSDSDARSSSTATAKNSNSIRNKTPAPKAPKKSKKSKKSRKH